MAFAPDPQAALELSARLCCVGILLQATELVWLHPELRNRHLLGRHGAQDAPFFPRRLAQWMQGYPANLVVLLWRAFAATIILVRPDLGGAAGALLWLSLFLSQLHFNRGARRFFANSDHMNLICLMGLTVAAMPGVSAPLRCAALAFMAFQSCLGYLASGLEKLRSAPWRSGRRLVHIVQDSSHRVPVLGACFVRRPVWAKAFAWGVVALEVLFPLCVVLPPTGFWMLIAAGLLFHGCIAVLMALPGFFWAFAATYPALYFVHEWVATLSK